MNILLLLLVLFGRDAPAQPDSLILRATGTAFDVDLYGRIVLVAAPAGTATLFSADGTIQRSMGGTGWGNDQFDFPAAVWMRNGIDVFVADYHNHRIQRFDRNLNFISSLSTRDSDDPDQRFGYPSDVALSRLGELYVVDTENARVLKFTRANTVERSIGGFAAGKGRLHRPTRVEIGPGDRVYVQDGTVVRVYDAFGNYLRTIGETIFGAALLMAADDNGLAVLDSGRVFLFDAADRPTGVLTPGDERWGKSARALVVAADDLFVLTHDGVRIARGVRRAALTK